MQKYNFSTNKCNGVFLFWYLCKHMIEFSHYFPITDPTLIFFVVLLVILFAPIVMGRLRIPHIIGMVLAGMLIGKYGLNILERDASFELFGKVGLYYIMFLAGMEMDLEGLKKNRLRVFIFGLLTFCIPFAMTWAMGINILGYTAYAAMLLGCIMASNTLIAYPIVSRYGLQKQRSSTLSVGSSMLSLLLALVIMAAIVNSVGGKGGTWFWVIFTLKFVGFCTGMLWLVPRLVRWFLRKYSDAIMQFIFVLAVMFMSAAMSNLIGLEGIFGAFLAGLILNRYIPHVSPLMNRIEFIGNAIFIPYFLIGVGMLINVSLLFSGGHILLVVACIVVFGTLGKAVAAYISGLLFRMHLDEAHMMFGLTSAHAAGAIAMVMVGRQLETSPGVHLFDDELLNGVVCMILCTCIISTLITEWVAKRLRMHDQETLSDKHTSDDEKIIIPVKYKEYADQLLAMGIMMRNQKLNRGLIALNVVYDDVNAAKHQTEGQRLLSHLQDVASAADVPLITQCRLATNIANGIKHAFKEYEASEIIMGLHFHQEITKDFWGQFAQSLYNGLNRQIIIARIKQPLNTIRRIQVAVPSRAELEPGFYRWLERLSRMAANLECRIQFHARRETLSLLQEYIQNHHPGARAEYTLMEHWKELPQLASTINEDHMFAIVTARKGTISYKMALERLPQEIDQFFSGKSIMIIYPDQFGGDTEDMTFTQSQHTEEVSAYQMLGEWIHRKLGR